MNPFSPNDSCVAGNCVDELILTESLCRHAGTQGSIITQLAFSPRRNLIAWTDDEGGLTRWLDAVPSDLPDPVRPSIGTKAEASVNVNRKTDADLFGDDDLLGKGNNALGDDGDLNVAGLDDDDDMQLDLDKDWIVDDLDGAFNDDKPAAEVGGKTGGGYVKEMGENFEKLFRGLQSTDSTI